MKWLNDLLGRPDSEREERAEDEQALKELRAAGRRVGTRTDRLIEAYERAEKQRLARKRRDAAS